MKLSNQVFINMSTHRLQKSFPLHPLISHNIQISMKSAELKDENRTSRTPSPHFKMPTDRSNQKAEADKIYNSAVIQALIHPTKPILTKTNNHKRYKTSGQQNQSPNRRNENAIRKSIPYSSWGNINSSPLRHSKSTIPKNFLVLPPEEISQRKSKSPLRSMKTSVERSIKRDTSRERSPYSVRIQAINKKNSKQRSPKSPSRSPSPLLQNSNSKLHIRYLTQKENRLESLSSSTIENSLLIEKYRFQSHKNAVNTIITDEKYIYSGSSDYNICIWHKPTQISNSRIHKAPIFSCPSQTLKAHSKPVTGLALLDENTLISSSADSSIRIWRVFPDISLKSRINAHTGPVHSLISIRPNLIVSSGEDHNISITDSITSQQFSQYTEHNKPVKVLLLNNFQTFCSGGTDGLIKVWDLRLAKSIATIEGDCENIRTLCKWVDGSIVSGSSSGFIRFWDMKNWKNWKEMDNGSEVTSLVCVKGKLISGGKSMISWGKVNENVGENIKCVQNWEDNDILLSGDREGNIVGWKFMI
ncbi:unnamed protein product [Blepharisma stoltei]|uniref:Uncharacterized protein n=1 Tax=Blepharisma stoltei TaxID=1481888 RepID=A0AAU9IPV8_9CILI|nr:unnamed protein product [Blepharisma stoltei]